MAYDPTNIDPERQKSVQGEINKKYRERLGRDADENELSSGYENYEKYGAGQLDQELTRRASNRPNDDGGGGGFGRGSNPYQADGSDPYMQLFQQMWQAQQARDAEAKAAEAERKAKANQLYSTLMQRSQQSLVIPQRGVVLNPSTPGQPQADPNQHIWSQVDNYRAEQERALRNAVSDAAESRDGLGPTRRSMAAERVGQNVGNFQAELIGRELQGRRAEIADALSSMGGMLSGDQSAGLQRELANLDNAIRQQQVQISNRGLDIQRELGMGGLSNDLLRAMLQNQQFYSDLGLRNRTQDDYYDLVRRGRLGNSI